MGYTRDSGFKDQMVKIWVRNVAHTMKVCMDSIAVVIDYVMEYSEKDVHYLIL